MLMKKQLIFSLAVLCVVRFANAQFRIFISANTECETGGEAFISQNKKIVFQLPVFQNNDSTVYLNKGRYTVTAITKDCEFKRDIMIEDGGTPTEMIVKLEKVTGQRAPATTMSPERAYTFGMEMQLGLPSGALNGPSYLGYSMPFWYPYANQNYLN